MKHMLIGLLLALPLLATAQDCCTQLTIDGRALFDAKEYALAKVKFELAKSACHCDGMDTWIAKCDAALRAPSTYTETVNGVSFTMIAIPGGTFNMGSNDGPWDEKPVHTVALSNFYIGETEVTQALWRAVMDEDPSYFKNCDQCPVEQVSWDDAQVFLQKLNRLTGKRYRLPTEAEWEYAAGGGSGSLGGPGQQSVSKGEGRTKWAGTNSERSLGSYAWFNANSDSKTHPVKSKSSNALGVYDMSGNVWEWCQDWYSSIYYENSISIDPINSINSISINSINSVDYVLRGGSWEVDPTNCRVANRVRDSPINHINIVGFRLAR